MTRNRTSRKYETSRAHYEARNAGALTSEPSVKSKGHVKGVPPDIAPPESYSRPRALELLASRPVSLVGMSQVERDLVIVTAVADELGNEYPVSRIGDPVWHMASESDVKNRKASEQTIVWPCDVPKKLLDDAKAVLYCALRRGPHGAPWSASSVYRTATRLAPLLRHLASLGITSFSEVRALYLSDRGGRANSDSRISGTLGA